MTSNTEGRPESIVGRRAIVAGAAWTVPVLAMSVAAPAQAASGSRVLAPFDPNTIIQLEERIGAVQALYGGDIETQLTSATTGLPISGVLVTYTLVPGTGSASFSSYTSGIFVSTDTTDAAGRTDSLNIYGVTAGDATLVVTAPGANTLTYPIRVAATSVLEYEATDESDSTIVAGQVFTLGSRIDLDLGVTTDNEYLPITITLLDMPESIFGTPVMGRPTGEQNDSPNWTVSRDGDNIVLTRTGTFTRLDLDGTDGWNWLTFTRPAGTVAQDFTITAILEAENPYRNVNPDTQTFNFSYV